ncbi:MAG: cation:proton antiporter regulatory subunit [Bacillota bacterium]
MSFFSETDLPGIGKKISCTTHSKEKVTIIIHHDGKREFYILDKNGESQANVTLLDEEARRLGGFLAGVMYKPKVVQNLEVELEGIRIDWFKLDSSSPVIGRAIGELSIRKRTQVSIIAVLRNDTFIPNPSSEFIFEDGDLCVVIGKPERFKDFLAIIR